MKALRLLFTSLTFCFLFLYQSNAQTIFNNTTCYFEVKANIIPTGTCGLTGAGPLFPGVPPGAVIPAAVPDPPGALWVPAYGVRRPGIPVRIPGEPACGYGASYFVGFCGVAPAFATYITGSQDLDIHF